MSTIYTVTIKFKRVLTAVAGAARLGAGATPLPRWSHVEVPRPAGGTPRITGVPAQHGPDGTDHLTGEVTGFVLSGDGLPTVYVSGDNASLDVVRAIADKLGRMDGRRHPVRGGLLGLSRRLVLPR